jgi:hypothetical protein
VLELNTCNLVQLYKGTLGCQIKVRRHKIIGGQSVACGRAARSTWHLRSDIDISVDHNGLVVSDTMIST